MGRSLVVIVLALVGLLSAAGMGLAAYMVSRSSVAVPVTKLQQTPARKLTPAAVRAKAKPAKPRTTTTVPQPPPPPPPTTTVDDHGGGHGGDGGGHGGDD
jgi:flagellar basal body-associated protein FliL